MIVLSIVISLCYFDFFHGTLDSVVPYYAGVPALGNYLTTALKSGFRLPSNSRMTTTTYRKQHDGVEKMEERVKRLGSTTYHSCDLKQTI